MSHLPSKQLRVFMCSEEYGCNLVPGEYYLRRDVDALLARSTVAALKYFPTPLCFIEPESDSDREGARIVDAAGNLVARLFWPCHPPEETEAAEQETYALGRAMAAAYSGFNTGTGDG